jgi:hypothetical protein
MLILQLFSFSRFYVMNSFFRMTEKAIAILYTSFYFGLHCKKELAIFPSPAGMSLTKLSLGGKKLNYSRPGRV